MSKRYKKIINGHPLNEYANMAFMPDLLDIVEKKAGSKAASFLATILGILFVVFFGWLLITYWDEIDWFQGSGGNPQESYMDGY